LWKKVKKKSFFLKKKTSLERRRGLPERRRQITGYSGVDQLLTKVIH